MDSEQVIREYDLGSGITVRLCDVTRHYFGGYYHVRIEVSADVPLSTSPFADADEYRAARRLWGSGFVFTGSWKRWPCPSPVSRPRAKGSCRHSPSMCFPTFHVPISPNASCVANTPDA